MSQNAKCIVDSRARHKVSHGTIITQLLAHDRWLTPARLRFSRDAYGEDRHLRKCARGAAERRGSPFRCRIDHVRPAVERRRAREERLQPQVEVCTRSPPYSNGLRPFLNSIPLPFASALSDCLRVFSATRPDGWCVSPSRSGVQRSRTARTRGVLNENARASRDQAVSVPVAPPNRGSLGRTG